MHRLQLEASKNSPTAPETLHFPRPEEVWLSRDVDHADWSVFRSQVAGSPRTDLPSSQPTATFDERQLEEDQSAERDRMVGVISEWNRDFFVPRGLKVLPIFDGDATCTEDENPKSDSPTGGSNTNRGFGFKLGNSMVGVSLPPNSHGYGIRVGGVLIGVSVGGGQGDENPAK